MFSEQYGLDNIDKQIIMLLQKNPNITHSEIAEKISRSQPAVGSRINKLIEKGVISSQFGVNFKNAKINLVKVEISSKDPEKVFQMANHCPFIVNCMRISGEYNIMLFLASSDLKKIDNVVNFHFRNNNDITKVNMEVVTEFLKDFIQPINFEMDTHEPDPLEGCGALCSVKKVQ